MKQLNQAKPCTTRDHIESIERPGYCCWCDQPMAGFGLPKQASLARYPLAAFGAAGCPQCGNRSSVDRDHADDCKRRPSPPFRLEMHGAEGDAVACIFDAIRNGGTLVLTGPNSVVSPSDRQFGATLEDASGQRDANAVGNELGDVLVGLVRSWRRSEPQ